MFFSLAASFIFHSSEKCVSVDKNHLYPLGYLVLKKEDCTDRFFVPPHKNSIKHKDSGNCVVSKLDRKENRLVLDDCKSAGKYESTNDSVIKDMDSNQCWRPDGKDIKNPEDGAKVILNKDCVHDKGLEFKFKDGKYKRFIFFCNK